ncbi:MAG: hypothetical protein H2057_00620 [Alphaproteobacteria bacterium]|nr:hypothetical protein [Alphaproteobacteria bacterium]
MSMSPSRLTPALMGHAPQLMWLQDAFARGRLPHGLLLEGPKGIGKATFAYHVARGLLAHTGGPLSFEMESSNPLFMRVGAGAEGNLFVMERKIDRDGKMPRDLSIETSRALKTFFSKTSLEGGWRVGIIDSVDELTPQAAQALLKVLEEPPEKCLILLIHHGTGHLLATLKSRCQTLLFSPLSKDETRRVLTQQNLSLSQSAAQDLGLILGGSPGLLGAFASLFDASFYDDFQKLSRDVAEKGRADVTLFLDTHFPTKSDDLAKKFDLFSVFLPAWLRFWLVASYEKTRDFSQRSESHLMAVRPAPEWTHIWQGLISHFQDAKRLSFDTRHGLILALERVFNGA